MIVAKFGGTSVGDAQAIGRTAGIIRRAMPRKPIVVVSALAGATNTLLDIADRAGRGDLLVAIRMTEDLRGRHLDVAEQLLRGRPELNAVSADVSALFDELAHLAEALSVLGDVTPRSRDAIASLGERSSVPIVTAALRACDVPAVAADARQVMITDDRFGRAEPLADLITTRGTELLLPLVQAGQVPVMGGYIGSSRAGVTTTLGRGGSDYSAALVGAALGAEAIEIWTDVDGMLTADPRVVPGARLIEEIRFDEASELAIFGAKVLHPGTIVPAVRRGIPVYVFNSHRPDGRGTRITFDAPRAAVRAIAGTSKVVMINVHSPRLLARAGGLKAIFEVFERHRTSVDVVATSEVSVSVTVDDDAPLEEVMSDLRGLGDVTVERGRGIVAVVGAALSESTASIARAIAAAGDTRLRMCALSATGTNLTMVVDSEQVPDIMRRIHAEFFGQRASGSGQ